VFHLCHDVKVQIYTVWPIRSEDRDHLHLRDQVNNLIIHWIISNIMCQFNIKQMFIAAQLESQQVKRKK